jgi:hypothetical protein
MSLIYTRRQIRPNTDVGWADSSNLDPNPFIKVQDSQHWEKYLKRQKCEHWEEEYSEDMLTRKRVFVFHVSKHMLGEKEDIIRSFLINDYALRNNIRLINTLDVVEGTEKDANQIYYYSN